MSREITQMAIAQQAALRKSQESLGADVQAAARSVLMHAAVYGASMVAAAVHSGRDPAQALDSIVTAYRLQVEKYLAHPPHLVQEN